MSLVDVQCSDGAVMLARICEEHPEDDTVTLQFFEETSASDNTFGFTNQKTRLSRKSITGYYDSDDVSDAGYVEVDKGVYTLADSDYEPSEEDESEDESLCDESEEDEEEED